MLRFDNQTCDELILHGVVPQADNDISGIGVILAFTISAYATLAIVIGAYVFGYIDHTLLRPVDIYVHRVRAHNAYTDTGDADDATFVAIRQCTLAFSDQQIVTGIAVLIAGFIGFVNQMSVYHFQMVIYLGWMSSSVHLSALTMLASFLDQRRPLLGWRVTGMVAMFVLLMVALFPTASDDWAVDQADVSDDSDATGWAVPAKCFWFRTTSNINADGPLGLVLLVFSYLWKVGALFKPSRRLFRTWIRGPPEYWMERAVQHEARRWKAMPKSFTRKLRYRIAIGVYATMVAHFEFFASFAASLWLSLLGLVWGTIQIVIPRMQNKWWAYQENVWTFGQITPLVLLIQPIGAVLEHLGEGARQHRKRVAQEARESMTTIATVVVPDEIQDEDEREKARVHARTASRRHRRRASSASRTRYQMSDIFAELELKRPADRPIGDLLGHQRLLFNSWYFKTIHYWIHMGILCVAAIIMMADAYTIGNDSTLNWLYVSMGMACAAGWWLVWLAFFAPFSRLFK